MRRRLSPLTVARAKIGLTLQPDEEFLERCAPLLALVDYAEVCPETLWRVDRDTNDVVDNDFHAFIHAMIERAGLFAVAHGVGLSMAALDDDPGRVALWERRLRHDHARYGFQWMSDHSGLTTTAGLHLALPVPVPQTQARAASTSAKLKLLSSICGLGLVETSAFPFCAGDPHREADVIAAAVDDDDDDGVLLDLHNVHTMALNLGFDADDWLSRLPLDRVIEIHVSGGSMSDPGWLPGARTVRLDSHDDDVPDEVFDLLARAAPRCPALRGVTLERMEGTVVDERAVHELAHELEVIRGILALPPRSTHTITMRAGLGDDDVDDGLWARALLAEDPVGAIRAWFPDVDVDGVRTAGLLIAKLRFERLLNGDADVTGDFSADPAAFVARFRRYHHIVEPTAFHPVDEAKLWRGFQG
ncbi:MAG: DUF692 family protein [Deltaproteobacteria bacterium]|nr:DUF692 family protein [Deltaproteobacteria bacterium]